MDRKFTPALESAVRHALAFLSGLEQRSVSATRNLADLRRRIDKPLSPEGLPADTVLNELVRDVEGGILGCAGGRFFGWVIGGSCPAAMGADWLTATWDQDAALYACGPAAAVVEEVAGRWLRELFGLPSTASFAFVSGCQMAHVTGLAAARHALLARSGWDVEESGLFGAPRIRVLSTSRPSWNSRTGCAPARIRPEQHRRTGARRRWCPRTRDACNWMTSESDVERSIAPVRSVLLQNAHRTISQPS